MLEHHPDLFEKARQLEKMKIENGQHFTWSEKESLDELMRPERIEAIRREHEAAMERERGRMGDGSRLVDVFCSAMEGNEQACTICRL